MCCFVAKPHGLCRLSVAVATEEIKKEPNEAIRREMR